MTSTKPANPGWSRLAVGSFCLLLVAVGCSDDDGGPTSSTDPPEAADVAGSWEMTRIFESNTCELDDGGTSTEIIDLSGDGASLEVINFHGPWGTCEVVGSTLIITGTESSEDLGCLATLATSGTATVSENEISGALTTTVTFDADDCGGRPPCVIQSSIVMTPLPESPCLDRAAFGDPASSPYSLPYPVGAAYPVYQSYCWPCGGHRNQLAYDFTIPIGDPIVAARGGEVLAVRDESPDDGQGAPNYVYVEHDDGTVAFYAHLMQHSVTVAPGNIVMAGEQIARGGNSGQSGEPHLHFGVYAGNPPVEGEDLPISFRNAVGPLDDAGGLIRWEVYTAAAVR